MRAAHAHDLFVDDVAVLDGIEHDDHPRVDREDRAVREPNLHRDPLRDELVNLHAARFRCDDRVRELPREAEDDRSVAVAERDASPVLRLPHTIALAYVRERVLKQHVDARTGAAEVRIGEALGVKRCSRGRHRSDCDRRRDRKQCEKEPHESVLSADNRAQRDHSYVVLYVVSEATSPSAAAIQGRRSLRARASPDLAAS